jgi:hypothetical protein
MPDDVLETVNRIGKDNERIAKMIRDYFGTVFSALKLQEDIQKMEDSMKTLELRLGEIEIFAMIAAGKNQPGFISDMKEQLKAEYDSIAYDRKCIVNELDSNINQLDHACWGLESGNSELIALNKTIKKLSAFVRAFKDSRADMMDLFAMPDVVAIYQKALGEALGTVKQ